MTSRVGDRASRRARAPRSLSHAADWALCGLTALVCLFCPPLAHAAAPAWSDPSTLSGCGVVGGPRVAFPSEGPSSPTGPGAIVWAYDGAGCAGASGSPGAAAQGPGGVEVAPLGPADEPGPAGTQSLGAPLGGEPAAVGGS